MQSVGMVNPKAPLAGPPETFVGRRLRRKEDLRFLTGAARYFGDAALPRMLHVAFVRSTHAHARIGRIALDAVLHFPGVAAVYTGEQIHRLAKPICTPFGADSYRETDYPLLAVGKVRFAGEPVVAVVAESRYLAEDAATLVDVEYDPLPPVVTIDDAISPSAPLVHEELPNNLYCDERQEYGAVDAAAAGAATAVEAVFRTQRSAAAPLECRGALAHCGTGTERFTLWTSTQLPHVVRYGLAECLGMPEDHIHVLSLDVGGGFGNKASLDPEQVTVSAIARDLGRPVKWMEDRRENFLASSHGQEERIWLRLSANAQGRFLTLESDIVVNGGAYSIFPDTPLNELLNCAACIVGPYKIEHYRYRARAVATTTCPHGPYWGVARPPANFALERLVNMLAARLRMDPVDLRRINLLGEADFPYRTVTGLERDSGDYRRALELAMERLGYREFKARQAEWRAQGRLVGVGVACFAEECATGTVKRQPRKLYSIAGYDGAKIRVDAHGRATVFSSAAGSGQGHETTLAQLAADELGIPPEDITVRSNDTDLAPYGMGSTGSRTAVSSGGAVVLSARKIREMLLLLGAHVLNEPRDNVALRPGAVYSLVDPSRAVPIRTLAWVAHRKGRTVPPGFEPGLEAVAFYDPPAYGVSSNAVHAAVVEVDPHTGKVTLLQYVVVEDTGRMINPMIVEGQVKGGVAQGVGKALFEEIVYDEIGQLVNASFPTARELCRIDVVHMETPSPLTLGGVKGCAEGGIIGGPAAIGQECDYEYPHAMKPPPFRYVAPRSVSEALNALRMYGPDAKVLAGGQSLVPLLNFRLAHPSALVDLNGVPGLDGIAWDPETSELAFGAMVRQADAELSPLLRDACPLLAEALRHVGHRAIRNLGTIGGSLAHADPSAELPLLLVLLDGRVRLLSISGDRWLGARGFFVSYLTTALQPDEILVEARFHVPSSGAYGWGFSEFSRRAGDFALAAVATVLRLDDAGAIRDAAIAVAGGAPTPVRANRAEHALVEHPPSTQLFAEVTRLVVATSDTEEDIHASAEYWRALIGALVERALHQACARCSLDARGV